MRRTLLALLVLAGACAQEHQEQDAGVGRDAGDDSSRASDAAAFDGAWSSDAGADATSAADATPDAPCPDSDHDGARSAICGGDDCDDSDPAVGPHAGRCVGPTRVRRCEGPMLLEEDCAAPTPDCDARLGACAASACGDLVLQPDEQCDLATGCFPGCILPCFGNVDCARLAPATSCVDRGRHDVAGECVVPISGGLADGSVCMSDGECASSWCDAASGRCTTACVNTMTPPAPMTWCRDGELYPFTPGAVGPDYSTTLCWHYACGRDSDCAAGTRCTVVSPSWPFNMVSATCLRPVAAGGAAVGQPCSVSAPGACDSNTCLNGVCTLPCVVDADCPAALPHCLDFDFSAIRSGLVQMWPAPRICSP